MAIYEQINIDELKRVPTGISFYGDELDKGKGMISIQHSLRSPFGNLNGSSFYVAIEDNLGFTAKDGTTGLQVLEYLGEFFEYLLEKQETEEPKDDESFSGGDYAQDDESFSGGDYAQDDESFSGGD